MSISAPEFFLNFSSAVFIIISATFLGETPSKSVILVFVRPGLIVKILMCLGSAVLSDRVNILSPALVAQ